MTKSPTALLLAKALEKSGLTQREIALKAGFPKPNALSMMKTGDTKLPIDRIPDIARACGIDPKGLLESAMQEYHPEVWVVLTDHFDLPRAPAQRQLVDLLERTDPERKLYLYRDDAELVMAILRYLVGRADQK